MISPDGFCERCGLHQPAPEDHVEIDVGDIAGVSDVGRRHTHNEDAMEVAVPDRPPGYRVAVVCDGVSAAPRSQLAAQTATRVGAGELRLRVEAEEDPQEAGHAALAHATGEVAALATSRRDAPACTYVSAVVGPESVTITWVGDSRAYWLAGDASAAASEVLSIDDSWAAQMVANGVLTQQEAEADTRAHALTGWLGADADGAHGHVRRFVPGGPGTVLLCTDGLWNYLPDADELAAALAGADPAGSPLDATRSLVRIALDAGGHDNVTVVAVDFPPPAEPKRGYSE